MSSEGELKKYHRALALYCLQLAGKAQTTGDLAELMQTVALAELHTAECWKRIDAAKVSGTLKSLTVAGLTKKAEPVRNGRQGRDQERWELVIPEQALQHPVYPLPDCPADEEPPPPRSHPQQLQAAMMAPDPYAHLSREQLLALVSAQDDLADIINRFTDELGGWKRRTRSALAAFE